MDVRKHFYCPLEVIDIAKNLCSGSSRFKDVLKQWDRLEGRNDAKSKRIWRCFNQDIIETLGDVCYLTHKLKNEEKRKLIGGLHWECFKSPDYELQNFEDNDSLYDLSALHKNDTFSVVDIIVYNGETILSNELHCQHQHDDDERPSTSESEGNTRRVILYTPKFVDIQSKVKALGDIFGKFIATRTARENKSRLWSTYNCVYSSKKGNSATRYRNCTHKTDCKVMVHVSTEDKWPFVIIDGIHNNDVGGAYSLFSAEKDIPQPLLDFIEAYTTTSSPLDIQAIELYELTIGYAHVNKLSEDKVLHVQELKKLLDKSAVPDEELLERAHKFLKNQSFLVFFRSSRKQNDNEEPDHTLSCISCMHPYVKEKERVLVVKSTSGLQVLPRSSSDAAKAHEPLC